MESCNLASHQVMAALSQECSLLSESERASVAGLSSYDVHSRVTEELRVAQRRVAVLKRLCNSTAACNSLPHELWLEIFRHARDFREWKMQLTKLTHVCRYWRGIAHDAPSLWNTAQVANLKHLHHCARLSWDLPLRLSFDAPLEPATARGVSDALLGFVDRVVEMRIEEDAMHNLVPCLTYTMPSLEILHVQNKQFTPDEFIPDKTTYLCTVGDREQFPHLRSLSLDAVFIPSVEPPFSSLSSLRLMHLPLYSASDLDPLLDVLEACQNLTSLVLGHENPGLTRIAPDYSPPHRVVDLPRLRELHITDQPHNISWLLQHLTVPEVADVDLCILPPYDPADGTYATETLLDVLPTHRYMDPLPVLQRLYDVRIRLMLPRIELSANAHGPELEPEAPTPSFRIAALADDNSPVVMEDIFLNAVADFAELLCYSPVARLALVTGVDVARSQWAGLFLRLPYLEDLSLDMYNHMYAELFAALADTLDGDDDVDVDAQQVVCPGLRTITVNAIVLDEDLVERIEATLCMRALAGARLELLVIIFIIRGAVTDEAWDALESVVGEVQVRQQ